MRRQRRGLLPSQRELREYGPAVLHGAGRYASGAGYGVRDGGSLLRGVGGVHRRRGCVVLRGPGGEFAGCGVGVRGVAGLLPVFGLWLRDVDGGVLRVGGGLDSARDMHAGESVSGVPDQRLGLRAGGSGVLRGAGSGFDVRLSGLLL